MEEKDINLEGTNVTPNVLSELIKVDKDSWLSETQNLKEFYKMFGSDLPEEIRSELSSLENRLKK